MQVSIWLALCLVSALIGAVAVWFASPYVAWVPHPAIPKTVTLTFDTGLSRCRSGALATHLRDPVRDRKLELPNGADRVVICDNRAFTSDEDALWRDLARSYPGCFHYEVYAPDRFWVVTGDAVCVVPSEVGASTLVCDGAKGRTRPSSNINSQPPQPLPCPAETLQKYGFR